MHLGLDFYNDNDPGSLRWLRDLEAAGLVAPAVIDGRSIAELGREDLVGFRRVHLFAGIAGWERALQLAGVPRNFQCWTGSCPCQPFSTAGRGRGTADKRHLWPEMLRLIRLCRPPVVFGEQVASPLGRRWLAGVRADLEELGYGVGAADLCAASVGAPHIRQRLFWVAYARSGGSQGRSWCGESGEGWSAREPSDRGEEGGWADSEWIGCRDGNRRRTQPGVHPLAHGVPGRVAKLRGLGNAIVPQVAAVFVRAALGAIEEGKELG